MDTKITEYSKTDAALAELAARYKGASFDVTTRPGMSAAIEARAELRGYRVDLEKTRVRIKGPALERCRMIDSEAARIKAALAALEDPIHQQIADEEARKEAARKEREAKEAARVAGIHKAIADVNAAPLGMAGKPAHAVAIALEKLRGLTIDAEEFQALADEAMATAVASLEQMLAEAIAREQAAAEEAARVAADRAELARLREKDEERTRAERERQASVDVSTLDQEPRSVMMPTTAPQPPAPMRSIVDAVKKSDHDEMLEISGAMLQFGGSFVKALAAAWRLADEDNSARIVAAFPEYVAKYRELAKAPA